MRLSIKSIIKSLFLLYLFIYLITLSTISFSATLFVNATLATTCKPSACSGDCYNTIQGAIEGAAAGDMIYVCRNATAGHTENVVVNKSLSIYGNQSYTTVIAASSSSDVFHINSTVNISNFTLTGATTAGKYGIRLNTSSSNAKIWGVNASGNYRGFNVQGTGHNISSSIANSNSADGFLIQGSNSTFTSNTADGNPGGSFYPSGATNITFKSNTASNTGQGFFVFSSTSINITSNNVSNSTVDGISLTSSDNNVIDSNIVFNSTDNGFLLSSSDSNILSSNSVYNNSYAIRISGTSSSNNLSSNIAYNNTNAGIYLTGTGSGNRFFANTIYNHTSGLASGIFLQGINTVNYIYSNSVIQNNTYGVYLNLSNFTNISGNTFNSNANSTFFVNSYNNIIVSNNIYNTTSYGVYVSHGNGTNITSNFIQNATVGIYLDNASSANLSHNNVTQVQRGNGYGIFLSTGSNHSSIWNNTASNNSGDGIRLETSYNNSINSNIAFNNSGQGIIITSSSSNNKITSNTVYRNTDVGISLSSTAQQNNLSSNTAYNNSAGITATSSSNNNTFEQNNIYNNSQYGFLMNGVNANNLSNNNATNNLNSQYQFVSGSNVTFTGVNRAFQTPSGALDLNITGGSNVTTLVGSTYNNFSNENLTIFFHNAINVSIKFMTNNAAGAAKSACSPSSISGSTLSKDCTLINFNGFNTVLNITNTQTTGRINLGIYFNTSDGSDASGGSVQIARYNSGWLEAGRTSYDGTVGSVRYDGITSFSIFGAVWFRETTASSSTSSVQPLNLDFSTAAKLTCPGNLLELVATSKGSAVSDVLVRLILYTPYEGFKQEKLTNAEGKAVFDLTNEKQGRYQLDSSKTGYTRADDLFFDFIHCAAGVQPPVTEPPPPVPPPDEPKQTVEYELIAQEKIQTGDELLIKATKDGLPCISCTIIMKYPSEEKRTIITDENGEFRSSLSFSGDYVLSLLDEEGHVAKEKTVLVESRSVSPPRIAPSEPKLEKKPPAVKTAGGGLDIGQVSIIGVAILIVLSAIYYFMSKKKR